MLESLCLLPMECFLHSYIQYFSIIRSSKLRIQGYKSFTFCTASTFESIVLYHIIFKMFFILFVSEMYNVLCKLNEELNLQPAILDNEKPTR